ncbi:MAG: hypothetical protein AB9903_26925 [Vulcanimicrobiota bacterium]
MTAGEAEDDTHAGKAEDDAHAGKAEDDTHAGKVEDDTHAGKAEDDTHIGGEKELSPPFFCIQTPSILTHCSRASIVPAPVKDVH